MCTKFSVFSQFSFAHGQERLALDCIAQESCDDIQRNVGVNNNLIS